MTDVGPLVQSHREVVPQLDFEFVEKNVIYNVQVTTISQVRALVQRICDGIASLWNLGISRNSCELRLGPALSTDCVLQSAHQCAAHPAFYKIHVHHIR